MKLDLKLLKRLYLVNSPSRGEQPMMSFIINHCYKIPNLKFEIDHYNNLFITKNTTNPEYYPCVVAHMDRVVTNHGPYRVVVNNGVIKGEHIRNGLPSGLGADDSNGICIALQLLKEMPNLKVVFTTEEEIGAIGAREAALNIDFLNDIMYFLQADRRGSSDLITDTNGITVVSPEFLTDLSPIMIKYGYQEDPTGTLTDIGELCEQLKICGCNISCGYYGAHSSKEYTVISELQNCLNFMEEVINTLQGKVYELDVKYTYSSYYNDGYDFDWAPDMDEWEKYDAACRKAEAEAPKEIDYESIPCDTCRDMDCMNCKYMLNAF